MSPWLDLFVSQPFSPLKMYVFQSSGLANCPEIHLYRDVGGCRRLLDNLYDK